MLITCVMRNARAHKLQWSGPTVHSSTVQSVLHHTQQYVTQSCASHSGVFVVCRQPAFREAKQMQNYLRINLPVRRLFICLSMDYLPRPWVLLLWDVKSCWACGKACTVYAFCPFTSHKPNIRCTCIN